MKLSDRLWGLWWVGLGGIYLWSAFGIEPSPFGDPLGPRAFPILLGIAMLAGGAALLAAPSARVRSARGYPSGLQPSPDHEDGQDEGPPFGWSTALMVWGTLVVYSLFLPHLGYVPATVLFLAAASLLAGERSVVRLVVFSVSTAVGVFLLFTRLLGISLPPGLLSFLG